jgi:GntR family transcriptional regulator
MSKYFTISQELISRINDGDLVPGMKIPSENEIISNYGVSNTTARKVHSELERAGYAKRIKGRGTFVKAKKVDRTVTRILGFSKNMIEAGYKPSTKLLSSKVVRTGFSKTINGRWYNIANPVLMIERLRFADDAPMMYEKRYISLKLCPDISEKNLEKSLYDIYEEDYGLKLIEVNQMLNSIIIEDELLKDLFVIEEKIPAFKVSGVTFCAKETILEIEESIYRGDNYHFSVQAT